MCQNYYKTLNGNITKLSILIYRDKKYSVNAYKGQAWGVGNGFSLFYY